MALFNKGSSKEDSENSQEWLVTYSDMVTLLLTFFILLFSMSVLDEQKFEKIVVSLRSAFMYNQTSGDMFQQNSGSNISKTTQDFNPDDLEDYNITDYEDVIVTEVNPEEQEKLKEIKERVNKAIAELDMTDNVNVIEGKYTLTVRFDSMVLFDVGSAEIKLAGKEVLLRLGNLFNDMDNSIAIEGHTDNYPIRSAFFPSNWELSTKRATNVVRLLIDESGFDPAKLSATGHSEYKPIRGNDTPTGRQKNRRIDIVIEK